MSERCSPMRRKRCRCCQVLYQPHPQTYRQQKVCSKAACRAWRIREKWKRWSGKDPLYFQSRKIKQKQWRQTHRSYWKAWRKKHPGYVGRNRKQQIRRNAKNRGMIAKPTAWEELLDYKIVGICKILQAGQLIAKPTGIDLGRPVG